MPFCPSLQCGKMSQGAQRRNQGVLRTRTGLGQCCPRCWARPRGEEATRHLASGLAPPEGAEKAGGGVTQVTVCRGAGAWHTLVSLAESPQPETWPPGHAGNFPGVDSGHSSVGSESVTAEGREPTHSCGSPAAPAQVENRAGTGPCARPALHALSQPRACDKEPGTPSSFLGSGARSSFLGHDG